MCGEMVEGLVLNNSVRRKCFLLNGKSSFQANKLLLHFSLFFLYVFSCLLLSLLLSWNWTKPDGENYKLNANEVFPFIRPSVQLPNPFWGHGVLEGSHCETRELTTTPLCSPRSPRSLKCWSFLNDHWSLAFKEDIYFLNTMLNSPTLHHI